MDIGARLALMAAHEAMQHAGLDGPLPDARRVGVVLGSSRGPSQKWEEAYQLLRGGQRVRPTMAATTTLAGGPGVICQATGARGPAWLVAAACASGAYALAQSAEQILLGNADIMLAGGADDALHTVVVEGLRSAKVLAHGSGGPEELCRPFGSGRTGLVPGNGAGMLVLESLSSAQRRGATPLAVLSGWGLLTEPAGMAGINASGLARTMTRALHVAGLQPPDIGYIHTHGTGTVANDSAEAAAITTVFGSHIPPCCGTKPVTGHCLGATAAMEAIMAIKSLQEGVLAPSPKWVRRDPQISLPEAGAHPVPGLAHALANAAAFWGFQSSIIFSRWQQGNP